MAPRSPKAAASPVPAAPEKQPTSKVPAPAGVSAAEVRVSASRFALGEDVS